MRKVERTPFSHDSDADSPTPEVWSALQDVDLADRMDQFRAFLESDRTADSATYSFGITAEDLPEGVYLPPQIKQRISLFDEQLLCLSVECTSRKDTGALDFHLAFQFEDEDGYVSRLSVDRPHGAPDPEAGDELTLLLDEHAGENKSVMMPAIARAHFNCFLASLIHHDGAVDSLDFHDFDWHGESAEALAKSFRQVADYSSATYEYSLMDENGNPAGSFIYNSYNDKPTDVQIERHTDNPTQNIETWITLVGEPQAVFTLCDQADGTTSWSTIEANDSHYAATLAFIEAQTAQVPQTEFVPFDDTIMQPFDD